MHTLDGRLAALVTLALLVLVPGSRADEEKVPLDKVPKPVLDAVKARYPGANLVGAEKEKEDGKLVYEVALKHQGHRYEVTLTPDGKVVSVEKEIAVKALPRAVAEGVAAKYPQATLKKAEEITKGDTLSYEVLLVTVAGQTLEVVLDPQGKIRHEERKGKQGAPDTRKEKKNG